MENPFYKSYQEAELRKSIDERKKIIDYYLETHYINRDHAIQKIIELRNFSFFRAEVRSWSVVYQEYLFYSPFPMNRPRISNSFVGIRGLSLGKRLVYQGIFLFFASGGFFKRLKLGKYNFYSAPVFEHAFPATGICRCGKSVLLFELFYTSRRRIGGEKKRRQKANQSCLCRKEHLVSLKNCTIFPFDFWRKENYTK